MPPSAAAALGLAVGGGLALLAWSRPLLTVRAARVPPLPAVEASISGRTVEPAVFGLAVVLLAGVVAVPSARGRARQLVGALLVLCSAVLVWRALAGLAPVGPGRARALLLSARTGTTLDAAADLHVQGHVIWPVLAALGGVVGLVSSLVTLARGRRWSGLAARYDAPMDSGSTAVLTTPARPAPAAAGPGPDSQGASAVRPPAQPADGAALDPDEAQRAAQRTDLELWRSLDRGEDPTARM